MEAFQPSGSFKSRGMGAACRAAHERGVRRVVCSSGGNAGLAVAYAGRLLGMDVTIVVPERTSERARKLIRREGAELIVHGDSWDDAHEYARRQIPAAPIHPFDDPEVWRTAASLRLPPGIARRMSFRRRGLLAACRRAHRLVGGCAVLAAETDVQICRHRWQPVLVTPPAIRSTHSRWRPHCLQAGAESAKATT
jgi:hypothetical protein